MALRNQPYLPLYVQDFLTDEKLMECSALANGVYIRLMCIMHKSETYGTILLKQKDKQNDKQVLNFAYKIAKFMPWDLKTIVDGIQELLDENVIFIDGDCLKQKRMIKDGDVSDKRALAGSKGGNNSLGKNKQIDDFAQAKNEANSEDEYEIENEVVNKKENTKINFLEIVETFNLVCADLPNVEKITASRKKSIESIIKEHSSEALSGVFYKVAESDFLSGRKSDWKASFDWILLPKNFIKILEGNYKNKAETPEPPKEQMFGRMTQSTVEKNYQTFLNAYPHEK